MSASAAGSPFPQYQSHKRVAAAKIAEVRDLGCDTTTDENPIVEVVFAIEGLLPRRFNCAHKPVPQAGWYYVQYEDGYESFSPADSFEKGYSSVDSGAVRIAEERQRQTALEGFTAEHDAEHRNGELIDAAVCYATYAAAQYWSATLDPKITPEDWPWAPEWWKPRASIRNLIKAGALIAAEIDRLERLAEVRS